MQVQNVLKKKTISGMLWSFSDLIINQGIQIIIQIILARLLIPEDFGLVGMITVFIAVSQSFIDSGFTNALIREKEPSKEDYSTVFYFNLFMAVLMYTVLFFSAGVISSFFKEPQLVAILRVLAIVLIINSFGLIQRTILIKNINFKIQTKISLISSIISGIIAIIFAYMGLGAWSLVIKTLFMQLIQSLLLCKYNRWIPLLVFKMDSFKRLFGFGWKILASGLINTLYNNLYFLIIGKVFSVIDLGYYTNAQKLSDTACQSLTTSVQKVSYPVLSSIKDEENKLLGAYKKIIRTSVFVTFPLMIGLAAIADPLIRLIFGQKWINSISFFQILCLSAILYPLHAINLSILQVKGRSDLFLRLEIIKKVLGMLSIAVVLFFKLGIIGLLWALVVNSFISYFINSYYSAELLNYSTMQQIKDIIPSFIAAAIMGVVIYFSGLFLPSGNLIKLMLQIIIGAVIYVSSSKIGKIQEFNIIYELMSTIFKKVKANRVYIS
jgi:O-antigen/teichoic acid export membrane protein